jgi:flagellin
VHVKPADLTTIGVASGAAATESTATPTVGIQFDSADHAQLAITAIQAQLESITTARANIGAAENRFASAVSTINTSITNLTAAKSRITDVDMASEMVNYSRANILSQSGTAMLAQANALPQLALKLLQG